MKRRKLYTIGMFAMDEDPEQYKYVKWTVLYGLATRRHISHHINKIYNANRIEYYQAYKSSEFNQINLALFTAETSEMMIKIAGIMEWSQTNNEHRHIFSLINKGYKFAWNFLKQHKRMNLPDFYNGMKNFVHVDESNFQAVMGIYVSSIMDYEVVVDIYESDENIKDEIEGSTIAMANILKFAKTNYEIMIRKSSFELDELDEPTEEYFKKMIEEWHINPQENLTLMKFIKDIKDYQISETGIDRYRGKQYFDKLDRASTNVLFSGKSRLFTILQLWLEIEGVSWYDLLENYTITKDVFERIAYFLQKALDKKLIKEEEQELIFSYTLILSALNDSFQKAKAVHNDNRVEEVEYQAQEREEQLKDKWQQKEKRWKQEEQKLKDEVKKERIRLASLQTEVKELKKELAKREGELEQVQQSQKELEAIEKFQKLQDQADEDPVTIEEIEAYLEEKRVIVIGGHPTWQSKLKNKFPQFIVWEADDVNKDLTPLDHADAVCIYWTYLSHPMYWKVKKRMNSNNTKLFFIERNTNLEKTITQIFHSLQLR